MGRKRPADVDMKVFQVLMKKDDISKLEASAFYWNCEQTAIVYSALKEYLDRNPIKDELVNKFIELKKHMADAKLKLKESGVPEHKLLPKV